MVERCKKSLERNNSINRIRSRVEVRLDNDRSKRNKIR